MRSYLRLTVSAVLALVMAEAVGWCVPDVPVVSDGANYSADAASLSFTWSAAAGCPVEEYQYAVGIDSSDPGSGYLIDWTSAGESTGATLNGLSLQQGATYYCYVKARDCDAEWSASGASDGVTIDTTPPAPPVITDSGQFTTTPSSASATWITSDPESPVVEYQYAIGTAASDTGGLQQKYPSYYALGNSITHSSPNAGIQWYGDWGMEASALDKDYLHQIVQSLQAINPANATTVHYSHEGGRASGKVTDLLANVNVYKSYHPDLITIQIGENDMYITPAQFKAYYEQLVDQLLNNTPVPRIVCFGLWSSRSTYEPATREYQMDEMIQQVCQARGLSFVSLKYVGSHPTTSNPGQTLLKWHPNDAGMRGYADVFLQGVGAYIKPWTGVGDAQGAAVTGLSAQDGQSLYWYVRARNAAGLWSPVAASDGVTVDTSGPWDAVITDDGTGVSTPGQLHAAWTTFDSVSPIVEYQYAIGRYYTVNPTVFVLNWKSTASADVTETGLPLQDGFYYYWYVKCRNSLGLWSALTVSDGLRYDGTPPTTPVVNDDGAYTAQSASLHASWTSSEPHTAISDYKYAIGTTPADPGAGYIVNWTSTGTTASATASAAFTPGQKYYFYVQATNSVGGTSAVGTSDGITIETSAPSAPVVTDGGTVTAISTQLTASWTCSDAQSGIASYQYAIGTTPADPGSGYTRSWTSTGTATSVTASGLTLEPGRSYYWYVKATNGAGMTSPVGSSNGIAVANLVSSPGAAKLLKDGAPVSLSGAVIVAAQGALLGKLYVMDPVRSSGIAVNSATLVFESDIVTVTGTMATSGRERQINAAQLQVTGHRGAALRPLNISPTNLLGKAFYYNSGSGAGQAGVDVPNAIALSTVGLLGRVVGRISSIDSTYVYLHDGSWAVSMPGIRIATTHLSGLQAGDLVCVTGIIGIDLVSGQKVPVVRPRRPTDMQILVD